MGYWRRRTVNLFFGRSKAGDTMIGTLKMERVVFTMTID
jgi:hypothetical protein